ncbi:MAG: hypothetical protein AB4426_07485 [Xenococcaceae cyanobacterium]
MTTVRKQIDEISPMSEERAKEIETMSDEEIDYSDIPPLDEDFFKKAKRVTRMLTTQKELSSPD